MDTYARPQQPNIGANDWQQLAGALAQISPSVQNFLQVQQAQSQKDAEDRAMRRIGGMSFEEARAAVDGGQMTEMDNPWFKAAFMKQYGERLAYQRVNELTTQYETSFDKNSGSFEDFVRQQAQADLEQYGNDPHFTTAYNNIIDQYGQRASATQVQSRRSRSSSTPSAGSMTPSWVRPAR